MEPTQPATGFQPPPAASEMPASGFTPGGSNPLLKRTRTVDPSIGTGGGYQGFNQVERF